MLNAYVENTLKYDSNQCVNCGMCSTVCPHGVFTKNGRSTEFTNPEACMECGACQLNCPQGAINVESGVGCAYAMILAALTGKKEVTCGGSSAGATCC